MDEEERERILAEARKNLDPRRRQEEQLELARRVMAGDGPDPIAAWKAESEALDAARAAAKAELQSANQVNWSEIDARIDARLAAQRQFFLDILKESMDAAAVFAEAADRKLSELEAILRKSSDHDRTRVLDLPPLPRR